VIHAIRRLLVVALLVAVAAGRAAAQEVSRPPSRSLVPAAYPRWDLSGSLGALNIAIGRTPQPWRGDWDHKFEYRADAGRYWTTHFKTGVTVGTSNRFSDYEVDAFPPGGPSPSYAYTNVERRVIMAGPALTWQFGENAFMHPYVSGGVQLWIVQQHRIRTPDTFRYGATGNQVPTIDERTTTVLGRPFAAGGFKSYISRTAYVRTEGRVGLSSAGLRQVSIAAGIGLDF
jgi:hypothetical protein